MIGLTNCLLCQRHLYGEAGPGFTQAARNCAAELGVDVLDLMGALLDVYHCNDHEVPDTDLRDRFNAVVGDSAGGRD